MRYQGAISDFPVQPNSDHNVDQLQVGSGSTSTAQTQTQETKTINYELLLKWGQKKRSRISRTSSGEESGSSSRRNPKIQKRAAAVAGAEKFAASASEMPPPTNLKACLHSNGTRHDRFDSQARAERKSPSSSSNHNNGFGSVATTSMNPDPKPKSDNGSVEKVKLEWPRIYVTLSRKEKEDDFFAFKGTKLPHRPKKRAKSVDKAIQYCYPGMWLSDLTRGRYEVREKRCAKKKQRKGLKGMEMDSDSE